MKILSSYSIKGGVGKTALVVKLAFAFQQAGKRTLLVDLDPQGAVGFYFRVNPSELFKLAISAFAAEWARLKAKFWKTAI